MRYEGLRTVEDAYLANQFTVTSRRSRASGLGPVSRSRGLDLVPGQDDRGHLWGESGP